MSFSASTSTGRILKWRGGEFSGDEGYVSTVRALIVAGEEVATIELGPTVRAAAEPEWVAWFTARAALDQHPDSEPLQWQGEVEFPESISCHPPKSVP